MPTTTSHPEPATSSNALDEARWDALISRDRSHDGTFVFAVVTTGVYCRPSCPARRPLRQNVRFFDTSQGAERAGFRACRRCRPTEVAAQERLAMRARAWLDAHPGERTPLADLAAAIGVSPSYLQRTFTRAYGVSPRAYQAALRLEVARSTMRGGRDVTAALHAAGYGSSSRFYDQARKELGMPPAAYRRGGLGVTITYTVVSHLAGSLLLAATEQGICAGWLGDDVAELESMLRAEFPQADMRREDAGEHPVIASALAQARGEDGVAAALDTSGTAFQQQVWAALRIIPPGETRSYSEIATHLGRPTAVRAVASACSTNPVAILIPCHRVVRADGEIGGYRWGASRKRALLAAEADRREAGATST